MDQSLKGKYIRFGIAALLYGPGATLFGFSTGAAGLSGRDHKAVWSGVANCARLWRRGGTKVSPFLSNGA